MVRRFFLSASILIFTTIAAGVAIAETERKVDSNGNWRVLMEITQTTAMYSSFGGLDSYPIVGKLENCQRIARSTGETISLRGKATFKTYCLNTVTGMAILIGKWDK